MMARTDLPRVRHSIVDQVMAAYLDRLGQKRPVRPFERMAINVFGATIADDLAIKLMTQENLSVLLMTGTVRSAAENVSFGSMPSLADLDRSNIFFRWTDHPSEARRIRVAARRGPERGQHQHASRKHDLEIVGHRASVQGSCQYRGPLADALTPCARPTCGWLSYRPHKVLRPRLPSRIWDRGNICPASCCELALQRLRSQSVPVKTP